MCQKSSTSDFGVLSRAKSVHTLNNVKLLNKVKVACATRSKIIEECLHFSTCTPIGNQIKCPKWRESYATYQN